MLKPRFICLDTASWSRLARVWKSGDHGARRILSCFDSGAVIPFVTSSVLEELVRHENDNTFAERVRLLRRLAFISFPRLPEAPNFVGDTLEAREYEMATLIDKPQASHEEIILNTRPRITDGFCSGQEMCDANLEWWNKYRTDFAPYILARNAHTASISHFFDPTLDPFMKLPKSDDHYGLRPKAEVEQMLTKRFRTLVQQLNEFGDKRLQSPSQRQASPEEMANTFLGEIYRETLPLYEQGADFLENMLRSAGVERSRLPADATIEDVAYESTFVGSLRVHERRLTLPQGLLSQIARQDQVPSWVVWREVNRAMKRLRKAEGSSLHDAMTAPFALYVDALEVDKRVFDSMRQAAQTHPTVRVAMKQVLRSSTIAKLADHIENLAGSSDGSFSPVGLDPMNPIDSIAIRSKVHHRR